MASLKVAVTWQFTACPMAPGEGVWATMVGGWGPDCARVEDTARAQERKDEEKKVTESHGRRRAGKEKSPQALPSTKWPATLRSGV